MGGWAEGHVEGSRRLNGAPRGSAGRTCLLIPSCQLPPARTTHPTRFPSPPSLPAVSCAWGYTTTGGAKGVGESTTSAVVISLVLIFVFDFALSFLFFQGQGDALRNCM